MFPLPRLLLRFRIVFLLVWLVVVMVYAGAFPRTASAQVMDDFTCRISPRDPAAQGKVNIHGAPDNANPTLSEISRGEIALATGTLTNTNNEVWYRLENGGWVWDADVTLVGDCTALTLLSQPADYCLRREELPERPELSGTARQFSTEHFVIHYTTKGEDAAKLEFVELVGTAMEESWRHQIEEFGFPPPPPDCGEGGDERFDVYLVDLAGELDGYVVPEVEIGDNPNSPEVEIYSSYSHLVLDNDYEYSADPIRAMRATAAHEFHHNIQLSYDFGDYYSGLDESGAVWMETQTFPNDQTAVQYVVDLFTLPDRCIGFIPEDDNFDTRPYGEWLMIDSLVRDLGADSLLTLWQYRASEEGMISFYDGLTALGTTPQEVIKRMAIRNLLLDYKLAAYFPNRVFIEGIIDDGGVFAPRRDGVMELGVDYMKIDIKGQYAFTLDDPQMEMIVVGIDLTSGEARVFELGSAGVFDTTPFDEAYLLVLNTRQHEEHDECHIFDWSVTVVEDTTIPVTAATPEIWNASQFVAPVQLDGLVQYTGTLENADNSVTFALMDLQLGDVVYVYAESVNGDFDPYITIDHALSSDAYDPEAAFLAEDDDSGGGLNALIEYTVETNGDYDVYLFPITDDIGDYRVTIGINEPIFADEEKPERNDYTFHTISREDGQREYTGSLATSEDQVIIEIDDLQVGDVIYAYAEATSGDLDTYLMLFDHDTETVAEDDDGGGDLNSALKFRVTVANEYYLLLFALDDSAGEYRVVVGINQAVKGNGD